MENIYPDATDDEKILKGNYQKEIFRECLHDLAKELGTFNKKIYFHYDNDYLNIDICVYIERLLIDLNKLGVSDDLLLYDKWTARPGSGLSVHQFRDIASRTSEIVLIVGSKSLKGNLPVFYNHGTIVIPVWFDNKFEDNFPVNYHNLKGYPLIDYFNDFFQLVETLYQLDPVDNVLINVKDKFYHMKSDEHLFDKYKERQLDIERADHDEIKQILGLM